MPFKNKTKQNSEKVQYFQLVLVLNWMQINILEKKENLWLELIWLQQHFSTTSCLFWLQDCMRTVWLWVCTHIYMLLMVAEMSHLRCFLLSLAQCLQNYSWKRGKKKKRIFQNVFCPSVKYWQVKRWRLWLCKSSCACLVWSPQIGWVQQESASGFRFCTALAASCREPAGMSLPSGLWTWGLGLEVGLQGSPRCAALVSFCHF